ncbi:MAG: DUF1295 domain-containing protein [Bacilli bacterium]|nr:DUF1295 domain-containing protein [Bacilli bacterium]
MIITNEILIIFIAVLIICLIGFKKYIWFISLGYGFSIVIIGIMNLVLFREQMNPALIISSIILIIYGLRLGGFLALREIKSKSYNKKMKTEISDGKNMSIFIKIMLWLTCALLYILMTSPIIYRFVNKDGVDTCFIIGMIITTIGIIIESLSDYQKNKSKKKNPNTFCRIGLYKIVRCPNYLGELIIWLGVFITGFSTFDSIGQLIISIIGFLAIVYIMFSGARRLELRQDRTYKDDNEYQKYVKKTPILLPFIPLYSVKKYKWLVG